MFSNCIGVRYPREECRRCRLWKISRYSKIALASSIRGVQRRRLSSSTCSGTLAKAVASSGPPRYERARLENAFIPFEPFVAALLAEYPDLPGTVIAERVGWTGSITWFRDNMRRLRPRYRSVDPADRISYAAGDQAQCDLWFPPARIPLGDGTCGSPPVLVIVASVLEVHHRPDGAITPR